jgi:hypothetical protein
MPTLLRGGRHRAPTHRLHRLAILLFGVMLCIGVTAPAALAAPGAPNFQMPVPCNETWRAATYTNHPSFYPDPSPQKDRPIDLNNDRGDAWEWGRPVLASATGTVSKAEPTPGRTQQTGVKFHTTSNDNHPIQPNR